MCTKYRFSLCFLLHQTCILLDCVCVCLSNIANIQALKFVSHIQSLISSLFLIALLSFLLKCLSIFLIFVLLQIQSKSPLSCSAVHLYNLMLIIFTTNNILKFLSQHHYKRILNHLHYICGKIVFQCIFIYFLVPLVLALLLLPRYRFSEPVDSQLYPVKKLTQNSTLILGLS